MNIRRLAVTIGSAAAVAGGLDFIFASVSVRLSGGTFTQLWQYVASGIFGQAAYSMGQRGALYGVLFHFLIMAIFSALMVLLYSRIVFIEKRPFVAGLIYGIFIWFVMNMLVVPLSKAGDGLIPMKIEMIMNFGFVMHMIFGIIIVLVVRKGLSGRPSPI